MARMNWIGAAVLAGALMALPAQAKSVGSNAASPDSDGWKPASGDVIAFDVFRAGDRLGTHVVRFEENDGALTVTSDVDLKVSFGPITFFSYQLDATEVWRDGSVHRVDGRVREDGDRERVTVQREGDVLRVEGSAFNGTVDASAIPSSHWNSVVVGARQILSTENGEMIEIAASEAAREMLSIQGQDIAATRYDVAAKLPYSVWYDDSGRWVKMTFEARGETVEYRLRGLY